jgi:hypothetical protein
MREETEVTVERVIKVKVDRVQGRGAVRRGGERDIS